ncbi:unnamed protein product [Symbiodinium sp. CCMP2592]|nr:unnamed protein product [Symbiodinium sp. CCMP2592]
MVRHRRSVRDLMGMNISGWLEDLAKDLLLQASADPADKEKTKSAKKDDKKGKKEKKEKKESRAEREKKKKKRGSSSDEKESDSDSCESQSSHGFFSEIQAMFCLRQKDLMRQNGQDRLDDLSTRQIAFVVSGAGAGSYLGAADLQEIGGELEAVHSDRAQHAKKTKQKLEENQATAQAALASTLWRKRLAKKDWKKHHLEATLEAEVEKYRKEEPAKAPKTKAKTPTGNRKEEQEEESDDPPGEDDEPNGDDDEEDDEGFKEEGWPASGDDGDDDDDDDDDGGRGKGKPAKGKEPGEEEGESSDGDLFEGKYGRSKVDTPQAKTQTAETLLQKLSPQIQKQAQSIEQSVLKSLPQDIPM